MLFFTQIKLANIDKKITTNLKDSKWYRTNNSKDIYSLSLKDIDRSEQWVKDVETFVELVFREDKYLKLIEEYSLDKQDLIDIFLLMTIATLPNPIFKTGQSKFGHTLVGSAMYQEINKQFKQFLNSITFHEDIEWEQKQFGHRFATEIVTFARFLKNAHNDKFGSICLEEI